MVTRSKVISKISYYFHWMQEGFPKRYGKGKAFRITKPIQCNGV